MLKAIKKLFEKHNVLSLYDLSLHLDMDSSAVEKIADVWVLKDKIVKEDLICSQQACSSCAESSCNIAKMILYRKAGGF